MRLKFPEALSSVALDGLIAPGLASAVVGLVRVAGVPLGNGVALRGSVGGRVRSVQFPNLYCFMHLSF